MLFVKEAVFIRILGLPAQRVKVRVALPKEDTNKNALIVGGSGYKADGNLPCMVCGGKGVVKKGG